MDNRFLIACITVLEDTDWIDLDWASAETQISDATAAAHQRVEGLTHILSGYLPSTGATVVEMFLDFEKSSAAIQCDVLSPGSA